MTDNSDLMCGFDITELITNNMEIDEGDGDFKHIINRLAQMSDYCIEAPSRQTIKDSTDQKHSGNHNSLDQGYPDVTCVCEDLPYDNRISMRGKAQEKFPITLFKILERSRVGGYSSIISWTSHGCAFKIHNERLFIKHIMKKYFFQTSIKSFKHQLYVYGFKRIQKRYAESGAYFHELFISGRLDLCYRIARLNSNGQSQNSCHMPIVPTSHNECSDATAEYFDEPRIVWYKVSDSTP